MSVSTMYEFDAKEHYQALRAATRFSPVRRLIWTFAFVVPAVMIAHPHAFTDRLMISPQHWQ